MINVQKLAGGMDTIPAHNAVLRHKELWEGESIILRGEDKEGKIVNWYTFDLLPQLRQFIFGIMSRVEGEGLGKVIVFRLSAGSFKEFGAEEKKEENYFIVLHAVPGVGLTAGAEGVMLLPGDAWWVAKDVQTIFQNNSAEDFIFLTVHAQPCSLATYVPEVPV